jgi:hypothetical protein
MLRQRNLGDERIGKIFENNSESESESNMMNKQVKLLREFLKSTNNKMLNEIKKVSIPKPDQKSINHCQILLKLKLILKLKDQKKKRNPRDRFKHS